jgi:carboxyl-terminal processing protease
MKRTRSRWLPALLLTIALTIAFVEALPCQAVPGGQAAAPAATYFNGNDEIPEALRLRTFTFVWEKIRDSYFDQTHGGVDWDLVRSTYEPQVAGARTSGAFHDLLNRMLRQLPASHLAVLAPHEVQSRSQTPRGEALSAPDGVVLRIVEDNVVVYSVNDSTPAWRAGLRPGQRVIRVDSTTMPSPDSIRSNRLRGLSRARRLLAGPASSPAQVTIADERGLERTLSIPRTVPFKAQANLGQAELRWERVRPRIGYLWFDGWSFDLPAKLEPALRDLADTDALIIDLRQNRGGMNPGADRLLQFLFAEPGLVAIETPRGGERREWRHEGSGGAAYRGRVAVLVDEGSGSMSELVAAALQEAGRAVVLGRTSYGGVLNATQERLPTGGIMQYPNQDMTTARGRRIEGRGVVPDTAVELRRADLLAGRDTVIEAAIEVLRQSR